MLDHSMLARTGTLFGTHLVLAVTGFGRTRTMWGRLDFCTSCYTAPFAGAVDMAQRAAEVLPHGVEGEFERGTPPDQHVVVASAKCSRRSKPDELA
jgi:hypothetical protein